MIDLIKIERHGCVLSIVMNRPEKKNALTHAMYTAMADAIDAAEADGEVRVILFRGEGDAFSAGNDMVDFQNTKPDSGERPVARFLRALLMAEKPVVAAVQGSAVGVGTTMLLHCDLVIVADSARLQVPFVSLALVPEFASSLQLPERVGAAMANDMFLTGRVLTGKEALEWGIASRLTSDASLAAEAMQMAQTVAAKAPTAVRLTKRLVRSHRAALAERMETEGKLFGEQLQSPEFAEAASAFMAKRTPNFG